MNENLSVIASLTEIDAADWDACANPQGSEFNPFVSHAFLLALELSGSASAQSGWTGQHLVLETDSGISGVVPCYLKIHSMGEYVFDHGWADTFSRAGGRYYPKLQVSVPFTPATGPRLLAKDDASRVALAKGLLALCTKTKSSSVHVTFAAEADAKALTAPQWLARNDIQFHWFNNSYKHFPDFLTALSSSKRKNIRKERQAVSDQGISFEHATGTNLTEEHWDSFYEFYLDTGSRKWGNPYLTRDFFTRIHETMAEHTLLILAKRKGKAIAGALNFIGSNRLFGRNWGCIENHPFLHFETCYYQAIDFAIARGLKVVEAGAQGEHKLARGYVPVATKSFHHLAHQGLSRAVADYLEHERAAIAENAEELAAHAPFRHEQD